MSSPSPDASPAVETTASPPSINSTASPPAPSTTAPPPSSIVSPPPIIASASPPASASSSNATSSSPPTTTPASASPPSPSAAKISPPPLSSSAPPPTSSSPPPNSSSYLSPPPPSSVVKNSPPPTASSGSTSPPSSSGSGNKTSPSSSRSVSRPPPTSGSSSSSLSHPPPPSSSSSTVSAGVVIGIAVGGVAILLVLSIISLYCCKKKRRRYVGPPDHYPPPPPKGDPYGVEQQQLQQTARPPSNPPSIISSVPSQHPSYPPPPIINSSTGSGSNNFSVSEAPPPSPGMGLAFAKSSFTYEELAIATNGFSDANLLGQGGFGYVHKGFLPNGKEIAVKQLKIGSGQGEREFQAEVEIISRVHHRHLVSLVGFCITGSHRLLVYEYVPNGTLEFHLHGKGQQTMDWSLRLKIALGSAKGLAYLHEDCHPKIIHRDIKAANILLDSNFEAMVADFGLAKFTPDLNTHVSTRVMGTFGYLAPEYASSGKLSDKSDVFSFGVVLLELITGRRPIDTNNTYMDDSLVDWARPYLTRALEDENLVGLVDPRLQNNFKHREMTRMVACAAACVRHSARRRPRMSQIVRALEGDVSLSDLSEGTGPGYSTAFSSSHDGSSDYDTSQYNKDMKKFRKMALASQEYASSDYSAGPTREYGLNLSGSTTTTDDSKPSTREFK